MMQQTMLRVKDPVKSLDFYTRILGMTWVLLSAFCLFSELELYLICPFNLQLVLDITTRHAACKMLECPPAVVYWSLSQSPFQRLCHNTYWCTHVLTLIADWTVGHSRPLLGYTGLVVWYVPAQCTHCVWCTELYRYLTGSVTPLMPT